MKKVLMWLKIAIYLPAIYLSSLQSKKQSFEVRFEIVKAWSSLILRLCKVKLVVKGKNNVPLDPGLLFVGNHQSSIDAFVFLAGCPVPASAVSKIEGSRIPILASWYKTLEVIFFDRDNVRDAIRMINELTQRLQDGYNMVIFPEGTRSYSNEVFEFKGGSFKPAIKAQVPIVPVAFIDGFKALDVKHRGRVTVQLIFCEPIHFEEYRDLNTQEIGDIVRARIIETISMNIKEATL